MIDPNTPLPTVHYVLTDGTRITIPRLPIDRAGLVPPCWVERPDGSRVWVMEDLPASEMRDDSTAVADPTPAVAPTATDRDGVDAATLDAPSRAGVAA